MCLPLLEERVLELNDWTFLCCDDTILQSNHLPETICGEESTKAFLPAESWLWIHTVKEKSNATKIPTALQLLGAETMKNSQSSLSWCSMISLLWSSQLENMSRVPLPAQQRPVCVRGQDSHGQTIPARYKPSQQLVRNEIYYDILNRITSQWMQRNVTVSLLSLTTTHQNKCCHVLPWSTE